MKTYKIRFHGRPLNAIGKFTFFVAERTAASFDDAVKALYDEFEHISNPVTIGTKSATYNSMALQAIFTKYMPATNTKGSKIKAYCERGSLTLSLDDALSVEENHVACVGALLATFAKEDGNDKSWGRIENWAFGVSPRHEKSSYVFVNASDRA